MSPAESGPHKGYFTDPDLLSRWDLGGEYSDRDHDGDGDGDGDKLSLITILDDDCSESELQLVLINATCRVPGLLLTLGGIYLGLGLFACLIITQVDCETKWISPMRFWNYQN